MQDGTPCDRAPQTEQPFQEGTPGAATPQGTSQGVEATVIHEVSLPGTHAEH